MSMIVVKDDKMDDIKLDNICLICHMVLDGTVIGLACDTNHKYHYKCIRDWYQNIVDIRKQKYIQNHKNYEYTQCPYCKKNGGYLTPQEGEKPIEYVHIPKQSKLVKGALEKCKGITSYGMPCKYVAKIEGYCAIHHKKKELEKSENKEMDEDDNKALEEVKKSNQCKALTLSGIQCKKMGQQHNALFEGFCYQHYKMNKSKPISKVPSKDKMEDIEILYEDN
jgi:hypothetical protein